MEYESIPRTCSVCATFGHTFRQCPNGKDDILTRNDEQNLSTHTQPPLVVVATRKTMPKPDFQDKFPRHNPKNQFPQWQTVTRGNSPSKQHILTPANEPFVDPNPFDTLVVDPIKNSVKDTLECSPNPLFPNPYIVKGMDCKDVVSANVYVDVRGVSVNKSGEGEGKMSEQGSVTESDGLGRGKRNKNKKRKHREKHG